MRTQKLISTLTSIAALAIVGISAAQDGFEASKPWDDLKLNTKKRVRLDFRNASIDMIVRVLAKTSGLTIVKDPSLTGSMSVLTPNEVSISDALSIFNAALELKGFQFQRESNFLVIKAKPKSTANRQGGQGGFPGGQGGPGGQMPGGATRSNSELRTYTLKFASAASVAKAINDAFSQSGTAGFGGFNGGGPGGGPGNGGPGGGPGGNQGGNQGPGGNRGGQNTATTTQGTVKASSEEYSNTVMVNAPLALQVQVSDFIKKIDIEVKQPLETKLYPLTYASASEVATAIQNVLTANATKGRGATSSSQSQGGFFGPFGGGNNSQTSQGTVAAETRSNSLIVTTSPQNHLIVASLLQQVDKEIVSIDASEVIPLANAKATDMATLLNQAFGTRTGTRSTTGTSTTRAATTTGSQRTNSGNQGGLGGEVDPKDIYVQMKDPNADSGELAANITVQQGFPGFGQQNTGNRTTSTSSTTTQVSRDAQGKVVNTTDLTGRVTVVADPNTNSLIVLGDPDAVARLKVILDQLDKIPQQVVIETMIVEASLDSSSKLGVEWNLAQSKAFGTAGSTGNVGSNFGIKPATGTNDGFNYTLTGGNLSAYINALKSDQKFQVLSTPRIFTSNNVEATINISQSVPYVTSQRTDTNGGIIFNYAFQDVGIVLTVTPQISPSGMVTLEVTQTANELQGYTTFNAPIVNQREANTTVSVKDGDTIVLGGIMRKTVTATTSKVPILGDIPILGNLFKSTSKSDSKTELLVFLTPRIVRSPEDAKANMERQKSELGQDSKKKAVGGK